MESEESCPLCQKVIASTDRVTVKKKGADGINKASIKRGVSLKVSAGTVVHKSCREDYINEKYIKTHEKSRFETAAPVKRSARVSTGPFDSKSDCFFCGNKVCKDIVRYGYSDYFFVKTFGFVNTILEHCEKRNDEWALSVKARVEYCGKDLHAHGAIYHQSCSVNFRTGRYIPTQFISGPSVPKKVGRPKNTDQEQAFLRMCHHLEDNDEEQFTVTDLGNIMKDYLEDENSFPYGNQYLKSKLLEHYGDSVFIADSAGLNDIVTFRETTKKILRDYFIVPNKDNEEAQKRAIIETATRFIKSDIKTFINPLTDEYPQTGDLSLEASLSYMPSSLRFMLEQLFVGKDTRRKQASIGQAMIQAVRPRAVLAPLQVGLAVQMHHHFRSRFLIDNLYAMGFSTSYSEVQRFEENAAASAVTGVLDGLNTSGAMLLFAADNVDHNIVSLDGKGTFHGMGMIAAITPGQNVTHKILRHKMSELNIIDKSQVDIIEYRFVRQSRSKMKYQPLKLVDDAFHKIDIFWEMSFRFSQPVPNWQGMMHLIHKEIDHPGKSSVFFLPMIDMYPGDKTCIASTLEYITNIASKYSFPPVVTFDQPLYWKACELQQDLPEDSPVKDVVLLLGSFHTLMNLLGAIGTLMDGSGLKDILQAIYGENAIVHMMTGKAVQRSLRGHLLVCQCLTQQVVGLIIKGNQEFEKDILELEKVYKLLEANETDMDSCLNYDCIDRVIKAVDLKMNELCESSELSKLWLNYKTMIKVALELIKADRTGSWQMHLHAILECLPIFAAAGHSNYLKSAYLYLQKMISLKSEKPFVFQQFMNGYHVIRRSQQGWAGLGSDLVIEQTLMRSLKSTGGLTRGSGMTEHQRALWTMSAPISSAYNYAMQYFNNTVYATSEQHKEATFSRMERDRIDLAKLATKFEEHSPFTGETTLRNIVTGINADEDVNVANLFEVGTAIVKQMEGQGVFSYSHSRKSKVKTLAASRVVQVTDDETIDPVLLFQRFLVVSQSGELSLDEVLHYELSPFPPALFEAKHVLRKPNKSQLLHAIRDHVSSSEIMGPETVPKTDHYVLDGGSLLHRLKWTEGSTYTSIADAYASFTIDHYGKATIVFDGYTSEPSTKDNTHQRRKTRISNKVDISEATKFTGKKEDFLSNNQNKQALLKLIGDRIQQRGCHVIQTEGDADVDIVKAAVTMASFQSTTLIGEDTDLLVLLLYHKKEKDCKDLYFRSDKDSKKDNFVYDIKLLKRLFNDDICSEIMFGHAFTGCDTTSRIFGVGKKNVFQKIISADHSLRTIARTFCTPNMDPEEIEHEGCKAMVTLFNGRETDSLESLRSRLLSKKVCTAKNFVKPERLPPTTSAAKLHSRRTYLQLMQWMCKADGMQLTDWGWMLKGGKLVPLMMNNSPAPESLLKMIHCSCSTGCRTNICSCKKSGLECTFACGHYCENMGQDFVIDDDELGD